jgi:hypothetical protein
MSCNQFYSLFLHFKCWLNINFRILLHTIKQSQGNPSIIDTYDIMGSLSVSPLFTVTATSTKNNNDSVKDKSDSFFNLIHIVNKMLTPEVNYNTWKEFVDLVYCVRDAFCVLVEQDVRNECSQTHLSPVLGCTYCTTPTLSYTKKQGPLIMQILTKSTSAFWCEMVSHFICTRALRAAWTFNDINDMWNLEDSPEPLKTSLMINCMLQEIRHTFAGAIPFSIYTLSSGFIATLLVKNFTFLSDIHNGCQVTVFANAEYENMLLTLCMGLHPRLGQKSIIFPLTNDLLRVVCAKLCASDQEKYTICHNQEEWLY